MTFLDGGDADDDEDKADDGEAATAAAAAGGGEVETPAIGNDTAAVAAVMLGGVDGNVMGRLGT